MTSDSASGATFRVSHTTEYTYSEPVAASLHRAVLTLRETPRQAVRHSRLSIEPAAADLQTRQDYFGNALTHFSIDTTSTSLRVHVDSEVVLQAADVSAAGSPTLDEVRRRVREAGTRRELDALEFLFESTYVPRSADLGAYAAPSLVDGLSAVEAVSRLMHRVHRDFTYDSNVTEISTPVEEVLANRHGVCQDFAHLMIACLRSMNLPARYVSGYLVPLPGVVGAQASHAWVSVYLPPAGWVDFDPTNDVLPSMGHITLGWGRDYGDVSPLRGVVLGGGSHTVSVRVEVQKLAGG